MRVLVTGASGFLGSHICEVLKSKGYEVVGASRRIGYLEELKGISWEKLDITDELSLFSFSFEEYDAVIHNAGLTFTRREEKYFRINHLGTRFLVKRLEEIGFEGPVIYISSLAVHGPGEASEEDLVVSPIVPYGVSKYMGELEVRSSKLNWVVLRPPVIFGERDKALVTVYKIFSSGWVLDWRPQKMLSVVYAGNVAEAVAFLLEVRPYGEVFLIQDATLSWQDFALKIQRMLNVPSRRYLPLRNWHVSLVKPVVSLLGRFLRLPVDKHKLKEIEADAWVVASDKIERYGYKRRFEFDEALSRTLRWCKSKGYL